MPGGADIPVTRDNVLRYRHLVSALGGGAVRTCQAETAVWGRRERVGGRGGGGVEEGKAEG